MDFPIAEWNALIDSFYGELVAASDLADARMDDGEWTLRDMVAHLIDSFTNNHQRFIRLQLAERLEFPGYDAETWRSVSKVDSLDYGFLCELWRSCNRYLLAIIGGIEERSLGNVWETPEGPKTLGFLVEDYFRHVRWHINLFERRLAALKSLR
jgi:hypothetical protein